MSTLLSIVCCCACLIYHFFFHTDCLSTTNHLPTISMLSSVKYFLCEGSTYGLSMTASMNAMSSISSVHDSLSSLITEAMQPHHPIPSQAIIAAASTVFLFLMIVLVSLLVIFVIIKGKQKRRSQSIKMSSELSLDKAVHQMSSKSIPIESEQVNRGN